MCVLYLCKVWRSKYSCPHIVICVSSTSTVNTSIRYTVTFIFMLWIKPHLLKPNFTFLINTKTNNVFAGYSINKRYKINQHNIKT